MIVKVLTEHHLEFLSLKGNCRGSSESTLVKKPNCWKSRVTAQNFVYSYNRVTKISLKKIYDEVKEDIFDMSI